MHDTFVIAKRTRLEITQSMQRVCSALGSNATEQSVREDDCAGETSRRIAQSRLNGDSGWRARGSAIGARINRGDVGAAERDVNGCGKANCGEKGHNNVAARANIETIAIDFALMAKPRIRARARASVVRVLGHLRRPRRLRHMRRVSRVRHRRSKRCVMQCMRCTMQRREPLQARELRHQERDQKCSGVELHAARVADLSSDAPGGIRMVPKYYPSAFS
jgi:hypothetical protein